VSLPQERSTAEQVFYTWAARSFLGRGEALGVPGPAGSEPPGLRLPPPRLSLSTLLA